LEELEVWLQKIVAEGATEQNTAELVPNSKGAEVADG